MQQPLPSKANNNQGSSKQNNSCNISDGVSSRHQTCCVPAPPQRARGALRALLSHFYLLLCLHHSPFSVHICILIIRYHRAFQWERLHFASERCPTFGRQSLPHGWKGLRFGRQHLARANPARPSSPLLPPWFAILVAFRGYHAHTGDRHSEVAGRLIRSLIQ